MFAERIETAAFKVERVKGIEPSSQPWEGHILPLNHTRLRGCHRLSAISPPDCMVV
jgi:hypothetical protein